MMLKKILPLILFLFLSSCGYQAIYSKRNMVNYDFSISKIDFMGDRTINLKIKEKLSSFSTSKKGKDFTLNISSLAEKAVLAKDNSGDPTNFKSTITVNFEILINNNFKDSLQVIESFNYKNNNNKFDLKRYEREILSNLAETATDKLIFKLSNIQ
tara:strand:+ start:467 stop:934 length:468 start_codon:yes stop_codon:yes gene_type:complete